MAVRFLRPDVVFEPLFNQWYANAQLIPPGLAAMHIANHHLKLMESFVSAPQVHVSALKRPEMRGGPFINYGEEHVDAMRALVEKTRREQGDLIAFAAAIGSLDRLLANEAAGQSMEPLYEQVPEMLRGYVELVYDLNNSPSFRLIEPLLYRSPYYRRQNQTIALSLIKEDERSFVFSTPRLEDRNTPRLDGKGQLHLPVAFDHPALDALFATRTTPADVHEIAAALSVEPADRSLFEAFFTDEPPRPFRPFDEPGVRIRYFGHACVLVETAEVSLLVDPVIPYGDPAGIPRYSYADLPPRVDYVLLTHNHQDHVMFESLLQLRHRIGAIVVPRSLGGSLADPSLKLTLQAIGFRNVIELDALGTLDLPGGQAMAVPFFGEHCDIDVTTKCGFLIELDGHKILAAADSRNIEPRLYDRLHEFTGDLDVLFIGMECAGAPMSWFYGPVLTRPLLRKHDQSRRLNGSDFERAAAIVERFAPKHVYVYAMGQEPWCSFLTSIHYTEESVPIVESNKLVSFCQSRGMAAERLYGNRDLVLAATAVNR